MNTIIEGLRIILGSADFYDAVNAYITLMHFDDVLENSLHTYIRIDDSLIEPITKETDSFGKITFKYKYSFNAGNAETVKGWETAENRDAIKEMGKLTYRMVMKKQADYFGIENRMNQAKETAAHIKSVIDAKAKTDPQGKGMVDVGTGVELELNISKEKAISKASKKAGKGTLDL